MTFKSRRTLHTFGVFFTNSLVSHISPHVRFVVSYISNKKELIADIIALNVKDHFVNKVFVFPR